MGNTPARVDDASSTTSSFLDEVGPMKPISLSSRRTAPTDSTRSNASTGSVGSAPVPGLRDNLMRRQTNRNPMIYYETIQILGSGSMGSVSKVKKRDTIVGGSARQAFVMSIHGVEGICFSLPFVGNALRLCTGKDLGRHMKRGKDLFEESPESYGSPEGKSDKTFRHSLSSISSAHKEIYYALKTILVDKISDPTIVKELYNEIDILKTLDHPNVVRPIETFNYRNNTCIVMELCSGGDLYTRDPYTEEDALRIVTSVLSAIEYMHARNIMHRDLKYENIMYCSKRPDSDVKIIDFGLSKAYGPETPILQEGCGTFYTMAPEVLRGSYTSKADVWSVGVIAFMLLSSQMPFYGKDRDTVLKKILHGTYKMRGRRWKKVSEESQFFVKDLLILNPLNRPTAAEALKEEWICQSIHNNGFHSSERDRENMKSAQASIEAFAGYSRLKKLALMVVAHTSTSEEIGFLRKVFDQYDKDNNGMITFAEFQEALEGFEYSEKELEKMFAGCDLDGTGIIHYTEFIAATIEARETINEEALAEAFDRLDSDDTGYISTQNLKEILGDQISSEHIEEIILEAENGLHYSEAVKRKMTSKPRKDHRISYDEFLALWDQDDTRMEALDKIEKRCFRTKIAGSPTSLASVPESSSPYGTDYISDATPDTSPDVDTASELQFLEEKMVSVRRYACV